MHPRAWILPYRATPSWPGRLCPRILPLFCALQASCGGSVFDRFVDRGAQLVDGSTVVSEGAGTVLIAIELNAPATHKTVVAVKAAGTASQGNDYTLRQTEVTIYKRKQRATLVIELIDDALDEADETILLTLEGAEGASFDKAITHAITVKDDDDPPTVNTGDVAGAESEAFLFEVTLSAPSELTVTVEYATFAGTATPAIDYEEAAGTLIFAPGETSQTITVSVFDDLFDEAEETVVLELSNEVNAIAGTTSGTATIFDDDDSPTVVVSAGSGTEGSGKAVATVSMSLASELVATVGFTTRDGSALAGADYSSVSGTLTFEAGETSKQVEIVVLEDALDEHDETFEVTLLMPQNATVGAAVATATIVDDDPLPTVQFVLASKYEAETAGALLLELALGAPSGRDVTLPYVIGSGSGSRATSPDDYTIAASPAVIAAGELTTSIGIVVQDDGEVESDEEIVVELSAPIHAALGAISTYTLRIIDDESEPVPLTAQTLDADGNGHLDHLRLDFSKPMQDDTFPGYVSDGVGTETEHWLVAGYQGVALAHGLASPGQGDVANDAVVFLRFNEVGAFDTGALPELTTSQTPGFEAFDGTAVPPFDEAGVSELDGAAPVLVAAVATEGSEKLTVTFSEPVSNASTPDCDSDGTVDWDDFAYNSTQGQVTGLANQTGFDACTGQVVLVANNTFDVNDLDAVNGDTVQPMAAVVDDANNPAVGISEVVGPVVRPILVSAATMDSDGNGGIDRYKLTFSKPMTDSTFSGYNLNAEGAYLGMWEVLGHGNGALMHGLAAPEPDVPNDEVLYLKFPESGAYDTGVLPELRSNGGPSVLAFDAAALDVVLESFDVEMDRAEPRIIAAVAAGGNELLVSFTEPVRAVGGACASSPDENHLGYTGQGSGVQSLTGFNERNGCDGQVTVLGDGPYAGIDNGDTVAPEVDAIEDLASPPNPARRSAVTVSSVDPPALISVSTMDNDGNGRIDHLTLTFSRALNDATFPGHSAGALGAFVDGIWDIAGYASVQLAHGAAAPASVVDTANDAVLYLRFAESDAFDTAVTPELSTSPSPGLQAFDGSSLLPLSPGVTPVDEAPPKLISAVAVGGVDLTVTFSEPVRTVAANDCSTSPDHSALDYQDGDGPVVSLVGASDSNGCDGQIVVTGNAAFNATDNSDTVAPLADVLEDLADNLALTDTAPVSSLDPPTLSSVVTLDNEPDGHIDHVRLTFSKAVKDDTFPGYAVDALGSVADGTWDITGYPGLRLAHGAAAPSAVSDTPNDTVIYLAFTPSGAFDTGAAPSVGSNATPGLLAFDGSPLAQVSPAMGAADGAAPLLLAAIAVVGTPNISLTFSEGVSDTGTCGAGGTVDGVDFTYTASVDPGAQVSGLSATDDACDAQAVLQGDANFEAEDVGATVTPGASITDDRPNAALWTATVGGPAAPAMVSLVTMDATPAGGDGEIDHLKMTFSKPVVDSTFPGYTGINTLGAGQGLWSLSGYSGLVFTPGSSAPEADTANDATLYLQFSPSGAHDTGASPTLDSADPQLQGFDGTVLAAFSQAAQDGAPPRLMRVVAEAGTPNVVATFSEPVVGSGGGPGCPGGTVVLGDFIYSNFSGGDVSSLSSVAESNGCDRVVRLTAGANITAAPGDIDSDAVAPAADAIFDTASPANAAPASDVIIRALVRATIAVAETMDANGDGFIDHFKLTFDKKVLDFSFPGFVADGTGTSQTAWTVDYPGSSYDNVVLAHGAASPGGAGDLLDDETIYLKFDQKVVYDTDVVPDVLFDGTPGLLDEDGFAMLQVAAGDIIEDDGAPPIIWRASVDTGADALSVLFSEPVGATSGLGACSGAATEALFDYDDQGGPVTGTIGATDADGCDERVVLTANVAFDVADFGDRVLPLAGIKDAAGWQVDPAIAIPIEGVRHPSLLTLFSTGPQALRVVFSEPVDPAVASLQVMYDLTNDCPVDDPSPALNADGTTSDNQTYDFATTVQTLGCTYTLAVKDPPPDPPNVPIRDLDENATMATPTSLTFVGDQSLRVIRAEPISLKSILLYFSKPVLDGGSSGACEDPALYQITPSLGTITAVRYDSETSNAADETTVLIRHELEQGKTFYTVVVAAQGDPQPLRNKANDEDLQPSPLNVATFQGLAGNVQRLEEGALFDDPFADGTTFSFVFSYAARIYAGPNDNNDAVFRFDPDGSNPVTITFQTDSENGTPPPYGSFGNNMTRPAYRVEPAGANTRYYLPPDTDLSWVNAGADIAFVEGVTCVNVSGNVTVAAANDGNDTVDLVRVGTLEDPAQCDVTIHNNAGPAGFDGVDAFVAATVGAQDYLAFGSRNLGGGKFEEIYFTQDLDTVLDNDYCNVRSFTLGNTESLQTIFGYGSKLYVGFAADHPNRPLLLHMDLTVSGAACNGLSDKTRLPPGSGDNSDVIGAVPYIGAGAKSNANTATYVGIDSITVYDGGGTPTLAVANNGGVASTTVLPLGATSAWTNEVYDGGPNWTAGSTQEIPALGLLRPGEKGVPFMVEWGGYLFVARNRSDSGGIAELWRFDPSGSGTWLRVLQSGEAESPIDPGNKDISMLVVNGARLYVGFDNPTVGATAWRTLSTVTADQFDSYADLDVQVGVDGLGPTGASGSERARNKYIISHVSVFYAGSNYLYVTVGCNSDFRDNSIGGVCDRNLSATETDFSIRMFRQID